MINIPTVDSAVLWDYLRARNDLRLNLGKTTQMLQNFLFYHGYVYEIVPVELIVLADMAMRRLQVKFCRSVLQWKSSQDADTAVVHELSRFIWGIIVGGTA